MADAFSSQEVRKGDAGPTAELHAIFVNEFDFAQLEHSDEGTRLPDHRATLVLGDFRILVFPPSPQFLSRPDFSSSHADILRIIFSDSKEPSENNSRSEITPPVLLSGGCRAKGLE